jgi:hypothetical protein
MKINRFITLMLSLTLLFACDDNESSTSSKNDTQEKASAGSEANNSDIDLPVQHMDFDTIDIEPGSNFQEPDMDMGL